MNATKLVMALCTCTALAACGGGGGGGGSGGSLTGSSNTIPASALASVQGLIAYMNTLIDQTSETSEPVDLGTGTLPVDDTGGPS